MTVPKLTKWPFLLGDCLLLGMGCLVFLLPGVPTGTIQMALVTACVGAAAALGVLPFVLEYRALVKIAEAGALTDLVAQIKNLDTIAGQISGATGRWQMVQEESEKTAAAARGIAERMAAETKAFAEFMQKVNDSEKATLRLEAEKLRRAESEWLQVLVRMLDHVYALHVGAVRSGNPNLVNQLGNFQNACRDAARRVGLVPFIAAPSEPFDPQRHQVLDGEKEPADGAKVAETVASGYTFQGRLLRPVLIKLQSQGGTQPQASQPSATESQLSLPAAS